jgi:ABC-type glycerol-3-phosphate transport system substrate-binding protein
MLAAAGITRPPVTIEELDEDCDKIFKTDKDGKMISAGFIPGEPGWWNFLWGDFFGGRLWDGKSKLTANCPENVRALTWIQHFTKKYGNSSLQTFRNGFGQFNSPQNAFLDERVAMEMQGVWMANFIEKNNPKMEWGAVPFPYPADRPDLKDTTVADLDILTIPRGALHPDEAFEFIKYVESQKGMEMLCLGQHKNSPLKKVSPGFYEHHPNPFIRLFNDLPLGKNTVAVPKIGIWPEYSAQMNDAVDQVTLLQKTPQQALDDVQNRMQPELDEHLERLRQRGFIK